MRRKTLILSSCICLLGLLLACTRQSAYHVLDPQASTLQWATMITLTPSETPHPTSTPDPNQLSVPQPTPGEESSNPYPPEKTDPPKEGDLVKPSDLPPTVVFVTPQASPTPLPTGVSNSRWAGTWYIYIQIDPSHYIPALMEVDCFGKVFSAKADVDGKLYTFSGRLYYDGDVANGQWSVLDERGSFWLMMREEARFSGNIGKQLAFCGARGELPSVPINCFADVPR